MSTSDVNHSIKFAVLVVVAFTKTKKKVHKDKAASRVNTQPSSEYFSVRMLITLILYFSYMLSYGESKSATLPYVLFSISMMSISNFEYESKFYYIKISMNAYKYVKL